MFCCVAGACIFYDLDLSQTREPNLKNSKTLVVCSLLQAFSQQHLKAQEQAAKIESADPRRRIKTDNPTSRSHVIVYTNRSRNWHLHNLTEQSLKEHTVIRLYITGIPGTQAIQDKVKTIRVTVFVVSKQCLQQYSKKIGLLAIFTCHNIGMQESNVW